MSDLWIIRLLLVGIIALLIIISVLIKEKISYRNKISAITEDLKHVLDENTDEKIMQFTNDNTLINLNIQINRILVERQKIKADNRRSQLAVKRMLSNISHDIRTPMTVIQGYIEILLMNETNDIDTLKKVEKKVNQVTKLIREFFTLSKLESGDYLIELTRVQCNELCKECIIGFYDILTEKDFKVEIDIPERNIFAYADRKSIDSILHNLISNAVRYGHEGKYLKLSLYEDGSNVFIDVIDKGKGIDRVSSKHVFDRLFLVDDSRNKNIQGNGLGLTIAKELAQKMNGDIELHSQPYIETIFSVKLKKYNF